MGAGPRTDARGAASALEVGYRPPFWSRAHPVGRAAATLGFAARVTGIDLGQPLAPGVLRRIVEAFNRYAVLVFPDQALDDAAQLRFSQLFGPLETSLTKDRVRAVEDQRISNISNIDEHGNKLDPEDERAAYNRGNKLWHSDSSFKPIPALASLLSRMRSDSPS